MPFAALKGLTWLRIKDIRLPSLYNKLYSKYWRNLSPHDLSEGLLVRWDGRESNPSTSPDLIYIPFSILSSHVSAYSHELADL